MNISLDLQRIIRNPYRRNEIVAESIELFLDNRARENGHMDTHYSVSIEGENIYIWESGLKESVLYDRDSKYWNILDPYYRIILKEDIPSMIIRRDTLLRKDTDFASLFIDKSLSERQRLISHAIELEEEYLLSQKLVQGIKNTRNDIQIRMKDRTRQISKQMGVVNNILVLPRLTSLVNISNRIYYEYTYADLKKRLLQSRGRDHLDLIYEEANKEIRRLIKESDIDIIGRFSYDNGGNCIKIISEEKKGSICIGLYGPIVDNVPENKVSLLIDILSLGGDSELEGLTKLKALDIEPVADDKLEERIDQLSEDLQKSLGNTLLYSLLAHKYGYCIPYMVEIEYKYNSDTKSKVCELTKEKISELTIEADRVTCEITDTRPYEDCETKDKELIILYTKVSLPRRTFDGKIKEGYTDNHISILLVDNKKKQVEYYEPLGEGEISITCQDCIKNWINEKYIQFSIKVPEDEGLQCSVSQGSCFIVNLFYLYLRMTNRRPVREILEEINKNPKFLKNLILKFISLLKDLSLKSNLEDLIKIFQPYESEMSRLTLSEPEHKEELERAHDLYKQVDFYGMKYLIDKSVYTSRKLPLNYTPENILILAYTAPHSKEELLNYDRNTIISAAEQIVGEDPYMDIDTAIQILTFPVPYDFKKAVKENIFPIIDLIVQEKRPPVKDIIESLQEAKYVNMIEYLENLLSEKDPKLSITPPLTKEPFEIISERKISEEVIDPITQEDMRTFPPKNVIVIEDMDSKGVTRMKYYSIKSILSMWENAYSLYDNESNRVVPQYPRDVYGEMEPGRIRTIFHTAVKRDRSVIKRYPLTNALLKKGNLLERLYYFIELYHRLVKAYDTAHFEEGDTDRYNRRDIRAIRELDSIYDTFKIKNLGYRKYSDVPSEAGQNGTQVFLSCFLVSFFIEEGFYIYYDKVEKTISWKIGKEKCSIIKDRDPCRPCLSDKRVYIPKDE